MKRRILLSLTLFFLIGLVPSVFSQDAHNHDAEEGHSEEAGSDDGHEGHDHGDGDDHEESHAADAGTDDHGGHDEYEDVVELSAAELAEFGIEVSSASPGIIETELELPGEVRPNDDRLAHIVPRYSGIVTEVRVHIGDYVKRGEVLAIVESDATLAPFEVKTMISGTVIGKHITLGEAVSRDGDAFVIADLSSVWIDLTVYQRDLAVVKVGQRAQVFIGHDPVPDRAVISYITPIVDEQTRTATARVILPNKERLWRPGMFVTAKILVEQAEVPVAVPPTALHTYEERTVVFLETADGFRPEPVTLGRRGTDLIEIVSGLGFDDRYVSAGGFTIKAELGKDSFGHGHAH